MRTNKTGLVSIPPPIRSGPADMMTYLNLIRKSLIELRGRLPDQGAEVKPPPRARNLEAFNLTKDGASYTVNVRPGYVIERHLVTADDALIYHAPVGVFDTVDPTQLKAHTMTVNQSIFVKVEVKKNGAVGLVGEGDAVSIVVAADTQTSVHHKPPIGAGSDLGVAGTYYYKLAQLVTEGGVTKLKRFASGHNIDHWIDLPTFETAGGETIWKEWDGVAAKYKTKGLVGISPILVTATDDTVDFSVDGGENLNLEIHGAEFNMAGELVALTTDPLSILYFRKGIFIGITAPGGDPPAGLITKQVTYCTN